MEEEEKMLHKVEVPDIKKISEMIQMQKLSS
jgi:hypothetical protein